MFKNPIKKYQSGGAAPSQEEQQVMAAFQSVADKLQIPVENLIQKIQDAPDENEQKSRIEAIARAFKGDEAALQVVAGWFTQKSKLGGKIHDFVCKHKKGGVAGCGCKEDGGKVEMHQETNGGNGKIAVAREKYTPESYFKNRAAWLHLNNGDNYTEGRAYRPYAFGTPTAGFGGNGLEFHFVSEGLSGVPRRTVAVLNGYYDKNIPDNEVKKTFFDSEGNKNNSEDFNNRMNNLTEQMIQKMPARISYLRPSNGPDAILRENGGVVKGEEGVTTPTLSRREALSAAKNTFDFSGSQARRAYANAKKGLRAQGLRGSELKQRAREMMFNMPYISDDVVLEEPTIEFPAFENYDTSVTIQPINPTSNGPINYDEMSFSQAFASARKNGEKTFNWRGKKYGTKVAEKQVEKQKDTKESDNKQQLIVKEPDNQQVITQPIVENAAEPATRSITEPVMEQVPAGNGPIDLAPLPIPIILNSTPVTVEKTAPVVENNTSQPYWLRRNNEILSREGERVQRSAERQPWLQGLIERLRNRPAKPAPVRISPEKPKVEDPVKAYIDGAGLGIGTDIVFDNGRYIWKSSGAPVEVPMVGRNGNYRPAVERNGGVIKGQNKPTWINRIKK